MNFKWTIYQIITSIYLIIIIITFNQKLSKTGVLTNTTNSVYITGAILFFIITWVYILCYFQYKKRPMLIKQTSHKRFAFTLSVLILLSFGVYFLLATKGPFLNWLENGSWLLYPLVIYGITLYYFMIMYIVFRISSNKSQLIHRTYTLSLITLFVFVFIF